MASTDALEPLPLEKFKRNSMLTIDATINGLDGEAADLTGLTGADIRWGLSKTRGGARLATLDLDSAFDDANGGGTITVQSAAEGRVRIQFRGSIPAPDDPDDDPFAPGRFWHECEVVLDEVTTTQFYGPVQIEPSMFASG